MNKTPELKIFGQQFKVHKKTTPRTLAAEVKADGIKIWVCHHTDKKPSTQHIKLSFDSAYELGRFLIGYTRR